MHLRLSRGMPFGGLRWISRLSGGGNRVDRPTGASMSSPLRTAVPIAALAVFIGCEAASANDGEEADKRDFTVLVFSKTEGFRHASIPHGIEAIEALGEEHGFEVEATEDSGVFTRDRLDDFATVVFLNTTGTIFGEAERQAFEGYIRGGGGYVGIHSAADTEYEWEWYGQLMGAYFAGHPPVQEAVVQVEDHDHPSTRHLPERWIRTDEWYDYRWNPREAVNVLLSLDPGSFEGNEMGEDHPIAWYHEFDGGRSWYTGGGHTEESFSEEKFLKHLLGGIRWAAGVAE